MAMSPEDADRLRKSCQRARRAPKPLRFFYCVADSSGQPVLLIDKRLQPAEVKEIRRSAAKKKFLSGTVSTEGGQLVFRTQKPQQRFLKDLHRHFGQEVPALRRALLLDLETPAPAGDEEAAEAPVDHGPSEAEKQAAAARERLRLQEEKTQAARAREAAARQQVADLIEKIHAAAADGAMAELAAARQDTLEAHFALLRQYLEGRIARRAEKEGIETDAELEAVAQRTEADARNLAYKALLDELQVAQSDLWEGAERLFLLDAEIAEGQAAEALAAAEREEARAESIQASAALLDLEDELAEVLAQNPATAPLLAESRALEAEADQLAEDAMDLQMELAELEAERDALVASLADAGPEADPALIGWLGTLEGQIQAREQELESLIQQTDAVLAEVASVQAQMQATAAAATGDLRTQRVTLQVARAREAVSACVAAEVDAERAERAAADEVAERARQRAVAQVLAEARAWQQRTVPLLEVLDGIDPRDPAEAERSGVLLSQPGVVNALADGQHYFRQLVRTGATAAEIAEIFAAIPAAWRPDGYPVQQAQAAAQASWVEATTAPLEERLSSLEALIAADGLVPDTLPDGPVVLSDELRQAAFAVAVELKARFRDAQDPAQPDALRAAATQAVLDGAAAEPRAALAWLAGEGDRGAQALLHAPDDAPPHAVSAVVLRALLSRARTGEGHAQTFEDWLSGLQRWTDGVFVRLTETIEGWEAASQRWADEIRGGASTAGLSVSLPPAGTLEGLRHALSQLSGKRTQLRERPTDADHLAALDQARAHIAQQVAQTRAPLSRNLTALSALRADLSAAHAADVLAPLDAVLHQHLRLLQNLSTVT